MNKKISDKIKRIISFILVLTCILNNVIYAYAEDIINEEIVDLDTVYVDGIKFDFDLDLDTGNILITGKHADSSVDAILYADGQADISINNNGKKEDYMVEINELNDDLVDVSVYQDGDLVAAYDDYDALVQDSYVEQGAITWSIVFTVSLVLTAVTASVYVIVHNGHEYIFANEFYNTVTNAAAAIRQEAMNWYYPAWVDTETHTTFVWPVKISMDTAAVNVRNNIDIYSFTSSMAKNAIIKAGYVPYSKNGTTGEMHTDRCEGKYVFHHWHKGVQSSSSGKVLRVSPSGHILYGVPYYVR